MNVLSLFDGISCGQIALGRAGVKVDNYFASEIDKHAIQVTQYNYPNTIQLGDVTKWYEWDIDWSSIDIVAGGSPCFEAGTKIITSNGYKNIEDIVVGDEVLTHKNRLKKVLRTGDTYGDIYEVSAQGMLNTYCTENHPYYVREMKRKWFNAEKKVKRTFSEPTWVEVKDLHKGHFIGLPINQKSKNSLNLTKEEAYIIGRYIADGHTRKDYRKEKGRENDRMWSLILSVGENKLKKFENNLTIKYTSYKHSQSTYRCVFYSKRLVEIVEKHCLCGAGNKRISQELLNLPIDLLKGLLDGYMEGDGCIDINDTYHATTISRELAMSLCLVVAKVYRVNCNIKFNKNNPQHIIEGRLVNQHDSYTITFSKYTKKQCNAIVIDDMVWLPIKSIINKNTKNKVYNLEVEEDNSYTANNIIVHNCQSFSVAGQGKGFEGKSGLFFEFADIVHNVLLHNPNALFLLENVVMKKEWKDIISKIMRVQPIMIDSALVSAQRRKRLYWTNIPNIELPKDKGILLTDILEDLPFREIPKCFYDTWGKDMRINKGLNWIKNDKSNTLTTKNCHTNQYVLNEDKTLCRLLSVNEYETLQTLPVGYTKGISNGERFKTIGNGWTVDVIAHIFKYII